jgi:DNA gyrase subunit A
MDTALLGRVTSGVKLINLKEGVTVASIAKVVEDKSLIPPEAAEEETDSEGSEKAEDGSDQDTEE